MRAIDIKIKSWYMENNSFMIKRHRAARTACRSRAPIQSAVDARRSYKTYARHGR